MSPFAGVAGVAACVVLAVAGSSKAEESSPCPEATIERLAERLPGARRFAVPDAVLVPLMALWPIAPRQAARLHPDGATVFARDGRPLLVAITSRGCLIGAFEAERATVWRHLREVLGPAI